MFVNILCYGVAYVESTLCLNKAGVAALTTAGIGGSAALLAFGIVLGAFAAVFAIAFGLGGRNYAERKLEEWDRGRTADKDGKDKPE